MRNTTIILLGVAFNILIYVYSQANKRNLGTVVPDIILLFILPLVLAVVLIISIIYDYYKNGTRIYLLSKALTVLFLLFIPAQFLLFSNEVLVK